MTWLKNLLRKTLIVIKPFLSFKVLIIYLPIYFIVTGWVFLAFIPWMPAWYKALAASWYALLWMPWMPEKLITFPLTIFLYKKIFLNPKRKHINERDKRNIDALDEFVQQEKEAFSNWRKARKEKRMLKKTEKYLAKHRRDYNGER